VSEPAAGEAPMTSDLRAAPNSSAPDSDGAGVTEIRFHSALLSGVLEEAGCSLVVSTYQAGQLVAVGVVDEELNMSFCGFDRAMGIAVGPDRIAVAGRSQIWSLGDHSEIAPEMEPAGRYDRCWLPRSSIVTGGIQCHEIAWGTGEGDEGDEGDELEPELWMVNTLFSCLATPETGYSFRPRWRPPFITALAAQDRCHLNGLAMRDRKPAFVTCFAATDEPGGWRKMPNDSGTILDVATGEVLTTGLAMPHSPRWHDGNLFVLNSGWGRLEHVDLETGQRDVVAAVPGYARGLAIHHNLAFIGLSRIRETATFGGTPIAAYHDQLKCGVGVIDLTTGTTVATLQFDNGVEEIFDVQTLPEVRCPTFGGSHTDGDEVWVLPGQRARP
jgi:uncharacterized protein (TIGR03032 family)